METLFRRIPALLTLAVGVCLLVFSGGCAAVKSEGFAIYLTKDDIRPGKISDLSRVAIADNPLIDLNDILSYDPGTYEITLTEDAYRSIEALKVPLSGRSFVVCVDRKPLYWGAFWTPLSSQSFDGITILKPFSSHNQQIIHLDMGYPASAFYNGIDPRNSAEVLESLERAGKLRA